MEFAMIGPPARSITVEAGVRLRALVWGRDDDPAVVLVHGNGGHAHWWAPLVRYLVPGWRVVAPDLRGHGHSAWSESAAYRLDDFAGDLTSVLDALAPGRVPLIGHSMGGRVTLWYAAQHPDRVRGLGILDSRLDPIDAAFAARHRGRVGGTREGRGHPTRDAAIAAFRFVPPEPDVPVDVVAFLAEQAVRERGPGDWTYRFDRGVLSLDGDGAGDLRRLLPGIACPTLVGAGASSWVFDDRQRERIVAALPDGALEVFPGGHHFLLVCPERVGPVLRRFLDALP
jgi:pimeloyl-ACP methyl ester carboxylesterase